MNLGRMCEAAARYSDRYDEYVKTLNEEGKEEFEGEALHWFKIFRDAINEAYFEVSRARLTPEVRLEYVMGDERVIDMKDLLPQVCSVCGVYRADGQTGVEFVFRNRTEIEVKSVHSGEKLILHYHYLPEPLAKEYDEPIFPESLVDPSVYIALAVARVWQSERKMGAAQMWLNEYYQKLRSLRGSVRSGVRRRLPRTLFR